MDSLPARRRQQRRGQRHGRRAAATPPVAERAEVDPPPRQDVERQRPRVAGRPHLLHLRRGLVGLDLPAVALGAPRTRRLQRQAPLAAAHQDLVQPLQGPQGRPRRCPPPPRRGRRPRLRHPRSPRASHLPRRRHRRDHSRIRQHQGSRGGRPLRRRALRAHGAGLHRRRPTPDPSRREAHHPRPRRQVGEEALATYRRRRGHDDGRRRRAALLLQLREHAPHRPRPQDGAEALDLRGPADPREADLVLRLEARRERRRRALRQRRGLGHDQVDRRREQRRYAHRRVGDDGQDPLAGQAPALGLQLARERLRHRRHRVVRQQLQRPLRRHRRRLRPQNGPPETEVPIRPEELLVPPSLLPRPRHHQLHHHVPHGHGVHRLPREEVGSQPLGPRRLPLRDPARQRPHLHPARPLHLLRRDVSPQLQCLRPGGEGRGKRGEGRAEDASPRSWPRLRVFT